MFLHSVWDETFMYICKFNDRKHVSMMLAYYMTADTNLLPNQTFTMVFVQLLQIVRLNWVLHLFPVRSFCWNIVVMQYIDLPTFKLYYIALGTVLSIVSTYVKYNVTDAIHIPFPNIQTHPWEISRSPAPFRVVV